MKILLVSKNGGHIKPLRQSVEIEGSVDGLNRFLVLSPDNERVIRKPKPVRIVVKK